MSYHLATGHRVCPPGARLRPPAWRTLQPLVQTCLQGAAGARNALLDEAAPCDLIVLFDDDVEPAPGAVAAYVHAFRACPQAAGFAGAPLVLTRPADLPCPLRDASCAHGPGK